MAVAEVCVIKSFRHSYISCNLYYSKYSHSAPVRNRSYKKDFIYSYFAFFCFITDILQCNNFALRKFTSAIPSYMIFYITRNHSPSFASCHDKKHMPQAGKDRPQQIFRAVRPCHIDEAHQA